jgi:hypothetical protein
MSTKITCYTLFDITQTGVMNRSKPSLDQDTKVWTYQRNTQCNFDTILQVISLRSQPESISKPKKTNIKFDEFDKFGFLFEQVENEEYPCWKFTFEIQHKSVFDDGITELGYLYKDCDSVPMILCGTEYKNLLNFLDISPEHRNIYFGVHDE